MDQQSFADVVVTAQMRASHAARLRGMRRRPLEQLAASAKQSLATRTVDASTIRVHGVAFRQLIPPPLRRPIWFADVGTEADLLQIAQLGAAVMPLVGDEFVDDLDRLAAQVAESLCGGYGLMIPSAIVRTPGGGTFTGIGLQPKVSVASPGRCGSSLGSTVRSQLEPAIVTLREP